MNLINKYIGTRYSDLNEYFCDITDELDKFAGMRSNSNYGAMHYVLADKFCMNNHLLAIRIPGGTVGNIKIDDSNVITEISVVTNYVVKTYPKDINDYLNTFVGTQLFFIN